MKYKLKKSDMKYKVKTMKYRPNEPAEKYFKDISDIVEWFVNKWFNNYNIIIINGILWDESVREILIESKDMIKKQTIFEVYYFLYTILEEQHSLMYYYNLFDEKDSLSQSIDAQPLYQSMRYNYKKYRTSQDEVAQTWYASDDVGLYENLSGKDVYDGHKNTLFDALFLYRIRDSEKIGYTMRTFRDRRIVDSNKVSSKDFYDTIAIGIEEIYTKIKECDYSKYTNRKDKYFLKSVEYYQLEKSCFIEHSYMAAYSLSQTKLSLAEKKTAIYTFRHLRMWEKVFRKQNKIVYFPDNIFLKFISKELTVNDIRYINILINLAIDECLQESLALYFGNKYLKLLAKGMDKIQQEPDIAKKELGLNKLEDFLCEETEDFFKNYFGQGQHIHTKEWNKIKLKDFREMYEPMEIRL